MSPRRKNILKCYTIPKYVLISQKEQKIMIERVRYKTITAFWIAIHTILSFLQQNKTQLLYEKMNTKTRKTFGIDLYCCNT